MMVAVVKAAQEERKARIGRKRGGGGGVGGDVRGRSEVSVAVSAWQERQGEERREGTR